MFYIVPIVEGHGEVEALPPLLHKIARIKGLQLKVNHPIRVKSGSFISDDQYFEKQVLLATGKAALHNGSVLILLDCEDECPAELGPKLLNKAKQVRSDIRIAVVLAYREFESWFIASVQSLGGLRGLPQNITPPDNVDQIRNAKGWLGARMNISYDPITHQVEFARSFDFEQAKTNMSFKRFLRVVNELLLT